MDKLTCPACSDDVPPEDMCMCREPYCWRCHDSGEHHWPERDKYELENGGDAA